MPVPAQGPLPANALPWVLALLALLGLALFVFVRRARAAPPVGPPDDPVVLWAGDEPLLRVSTCLSGVLFVAETGAGKSSTAEHLAFNLLRHGASFLWLCPKVDECQRAIRLCQEAGRADDVIRLAPDEKHSPEKTLNSGGVPSL